MARSSKQKIEANRLDEDVAVAFDDANRNHHDDDSDADVDYPPERFDDPPGHFDEGLVYEDGDDGRNDGREESGGKPLLSDEELKAFHDYAERMRRSVAYAKCDDHGNYTIGDKDVTGATVLAPLDYLIKQRSLWIGGKPVESHGHLWRELKGKQPPRPDTFNDRSKWKKYNKNGKETDPWNNFQDILPLIAGSGGVISLQASTFAVKAAIAELLQEFIASGGKRRPYIQLTSDKNTETGESYPKLLIVGWADTNEDLGFLEMLIKDDPEYPEPEEQKWTDFGDD